MDAHSTPASEPDVTNQEITEEIPPPEETKVAQDDAELDDILDSALGDFEKCSVPPTTAAEHPGIATETELSKTSSSQAAAATGGSTSKTPHSKPDSQSEQEKLFDQIFNSVQAGQDQAGGSADSAQAQFENMMKALMAEEPQMTEHFQNLTEAVNNAETDPENSGETLQHTIHQTLGGLAQNVQNIQSELSEDDLIRMMSEMNFEGESGPGGEQPFLPMMQGMMKSLLSKDVLYPSLKEITSKYPAWLEENKGKVEDKMHEDYSKQFDLMKQICVEFESEKSSDTDQEKQQRFDKIMDFMQQMQAYGQPPQEIVGEMAPGLEFDESGMPKFPGSSEQCSIM